MYRRTGISILVVSGAMLMGACGSGGSKTSGSSSPTVDASATGSASAASAAPSGANGANGGPVYLGPAGYGAVKLGMKRADAEATGLITVKSEPPGGIGCGTFDFKKFPQKGPYSGGNFSPQLGVASIFAVGDMRTPEGITTGSASAEVEKAYPELKKGPNASFVTVPGNPKAVYTFLLENGRVRQLALDLATQICHN